MRSPVSGRARARLGRHCPAEQKLPADTRDREGAPDDSEDSPSVADRTLEGKMMGDVGDGQAEPPPEHEPPSEQGRVSAAFREPSDIIQIVACSSCAVAHPASPKGL